MRFSLPASANFATTRSTVRLDLPIAVATSLRLREGCFDSSDSIFAEASAGVLSDIFSDIFSDTFSDVSPGVSPELLVLTNRR